MFEHNYTLKNGFLHCGETPDYRVDIDVKLAAKHPYKAAQLPNARLKDGTV